MVGRPRLAGDERPFSVNVYLTREEWLPLVAAANANGQSKSKIIRNLLKEKFTHAESSPPQDCLESEI
jgi:hypothetical protein